MVNSIMGGPDTQKPEKLGSNMFLQNMDSGWICHTTQDILTSNIGDKVNHPIPRGTFLSINSQLIIDREPYTNVTVLKTDLIPREGKETLIVIVGRDYDCTVKW